MALVDHIGIVESVSNGIIHTIEGNSMKRRTKTNQDSRLVVTEDNHNTQPGN